MMNLRGTLGAVAVSLLVAAPLQAQNPSDWDTPSVWTKIFDGTFTGGTGFNTTMSVDLRYVAGTGGVYFVGLDIANQGTYGEVYKAIGLVNLPLSGITVSIPDASDPYQNSLSGWDSPPPEDLGGAGLPDATWAWISPNPAPTNGLTTSLGHQFFVFKVTGISTTQLADLGVGVHAISGPNGCSMKYGVWNGGDDSNDVPGDITTTECGATVVPEPATVALVGTGLLGLAFVARRRRELFQIVDENDQEITSL